MSATFPSHQLTLHTFGDISRFLREGVADEESRQLRDSLGQLSHHIDAALQLRRASQDTQAIARQIAALSQCVRTHQLFLTGLGSAWHALYEFAAYQRALQALVRAVRVWQLALERRSRTERQAFDQFELLAWRTLGEALLLLDMYAHQSEAYDETAGAGGAPRSSVWQRLRRWLLRVGR